MPRTAAGYDTTAGAFSVSSIILQRVIYTFHINYARSFAKYSRTSFTTVPDSRNNATKFGMDISPLHVSAIPQIIPKSTVAPRIATSA